MRVTSATTSGWGAGSRCTVQRETPRDEAIWASEKPPDCRAAATNTCRPGPGVANRAGEVRVRALAAATSIRQVGFPASERQTGNDVPSTPTLGSEET